jgi:hypothetical protein
MAHVELTSVAPPQDLHDREIDPPRGGRFAPGPRGHSLAPYQRLVANPFLAAGVVCGAIFLIQTSLAWKRLDLFGAALFAILVTPFLFQYHCLDCGQTGHLTRASRHACPIVELRVLNSQGRLVRGPSPAIQTKLWLAVLLVFVLLFLFGAA